MVIISSSVYTGRPSDICLNINSNATGQKKAKEDLSTVFPFKITQSKVSGLCICSFIYFVLFTGDLRSSI